MSRREVQGEARGVCGKPRRTAMHGVETNAADKPTFRQTSDEPVQRVRDMLYAPARTPVPENAKTCAGAAAKEVHSMRGKEEQSAQTEMRECRKPPRFYVREQPFAFTRRKKP